MLGHLFRLLEFSIIIRRHQQKSVTCMFLAWSVLLQCDNAATQTMLVDAAD